MDQLSCEANVGSWTSSGITPNDDDFVSHTSSNPYEKLFSSHDSWILPQRTPSSAALRVSEILQIDDFDEVGKDPSLLPPREDLSLQKQRKMPPIWTQKVQVNPGVGLEGALDDGYSWRKYGQKDIPRAKYPRLPKLTVQVKINPETGLEGADDDGYSWRKYGQKDILGAMYPRSYYRCTYSNTQNCWATKQVQRSDEDPTVFEITYRGTHTCSYAGAQNPAPAPAPASPQKQEQHHQQQQQQQQQMKINRCFTNTFQQNQSQEILSKLKAGLRVETGSLDNVGMSFPPFPFPSTSFGHLQTEHYSSSNLVGSFSSSQNPAPAWLADLAPSSAKTQEQDLIFQYKNMHDFKLDPNSQRSKSVITEVIS